MTLENISLTVVNSENVDKYGVFCAKDKRSEAYNVKVDWLKNKKNDSSRLVIAMDEKQKQLGYIEFTTGEEAWRPVNANNYLFINCIAVMLKKDRQLGLGGRLIGKVEEIALGNGKFGVCVMTSKGTWLANDTLYKKNGYIMVDSKGRFDLLVKKFDEDSINPVLIDWASEAEKYMGLNLIYADQCPWHIKSVTDMMDEAKLRGVGLKIHKITSPEEAQRAPSGYGTFGLVYNGRLLADHYISRTRFKNILDKEVK